MNIYTSHIGINMHGASYSWTRPLLWSIFILFVIVAGYTIAHHEPWGDEIHSWNITKGSASFLDLIRNTRFEGHPPVWYTIMWPISQFTHNYVYVQAIHLIIASLTVFLVLFFSPFSFSTKILIPFGYYFLYEYAILSRNYAIGVLLVFCICIVIRKNFKYKPVIYYSLLFLLSNTHLLGLLLAGSLHLYFLLQNMEQKKPMRSVLLPVLLGALVFLPALYFISPPSDSQLNVQFWLDRWTKHNLTAFIQAPLRSFAPVPAWWNFSFWHTQFLLEAKNEYPIFKVINLFVSIIFPLLAFFILRKNKKSLVLFITNFLLTFIIAIAVFPLTSARYAGFIYIGFIAAYWLYCYETPVTSNNKWLINGLLLIQLAGGVFAVVKDIQYPFSNFNKVNELLKEVPGNERVVTDYWALNTVIAFTDKGLYCIDLQKDISFVLWDSDLGAMSKKPYRYFDGVKNYFQREGVNKVYLVSTGSLKTLQSVDSYLSKYYRVTLIDKREGALEKGGNLYLYRISSE